MGSRKIKYKVSRKFNIGYMYVETLEGTMTRSLGDYIVKGVNGEFYPVKPDIFERTYDILPDVIKADYIWDKEEWEWKIIKMTRNILLK